MADGRSSSSFSFSSSPVEEHGRTPPKKRGLSCFLPSFLPSFLIWCTEAFLSCYLLPWHSFVVIRCRLRLWPMRGSSCGGITANHVGLQGSGKRPQRARLLKSGVPVGISPGLCCQKQKAKKNARAATPRRHPRAALAASAPPLAAFLSRLIRMIRVIRVIRGRLSRRAGLLSRCAPPQSSAT